MQSPGRFHGPWSVAPNAERHNLYGISMNARLGGAASARIFQPTYIQLPTWGIAQQHRTGKSSHPAVILQILRCYPRVAVLCRIPIAMGDENCWAALSGRPHLAQGGKSR